MKLEDARNIIRHTQAAGKDLKLQPLAVVVLDAGGNVLAFEKEDGCSNLRFEIAHAKAYGAIGFGMNSRDLQTMAIDRPHFVSSVTSAFGGSLIPSPGGVLIKNQEGELVGVVGVTGDIGDNDEKAAIAGVEAAGFGI